MVVSFCENVKNLEIFLEMLRSLRSLEVKLVLRDFVLLSLFRE